MTTPAYRCHIHPFAPQLIDIISTDELILSKPSIKFFAKNITKRNVKEKSVLNEFIKWSSVGICVRINRINSRAQKLFTKHSSSISVHDI